MCDSSDTMSLDHWRGFFETFHACTETCPPACERRRQLGIVALVVFRLCEYMSGLLIFPELFTEDECRCICKEVLTKVWQVNNLANESTGPPESAKFSQIMDSAYAIAKETFENERAFVGWLV